MDSILNSFNNTWPYVQVAILFFQTVIMLGMAWLLYRLISGLSKRWLAYRAAQKQLPSDTLLAVQRRGDILILTVHKDTVIEPNRLVDLLHTQSGAETQALEHQEDTAKPASDSDVSQE